MTRAAERVSVVIPTKNRPQKLARCLRAIEAARERLPCAVVVLDASTDPGTRSAVSAVCERWDFVRLVFHDGANVAAARNACARAAATELLVNVDDDIQIHPDALERLVARYEASDGLRVVGGSVAWGDWWSRPVVLHPYGHGRSARPEERPSFIIGAFFLYPRAFALRWPWNESIRTSDDRFMGAVWRSKGVQLLFEPAARAIHDPEHVRYGPADARSRIYANLFDALIANPSLSRALSYELLGFAVLLKQHGRRPRGALVCLRAWVSGHVALLRDLRRLRRMLAR